MPTKTKRNEDEVEVRLRRLVDSAPKNLQDTIKAYYMCARGEMRTSAIVHAHLVKAALANSSSTECFAEMAIFLAKELDDAIEAILTHSKICPRNLLAIAVPNIPPKDAAPN